MIRSTFPRLILACAALAAALSPPAARATDAEGRGPRQPPTRLATGQFITPTAMRGAIQQLLNPGLPGYPNFVAGQAVRTRLSPDGATLAVLCAGQNSLVKPDGATDVANSTQYVFLYDVSGDRKRAPVLTQVLKQTNAHVGLEFTPDGRLWATGGRDDAVYVYAKGGGAWSQVGKVSLGHGSAGLGVRVGPNASGLGVSEDGKTLVVANNYNDSISVIDTATLTVRYEHDLRPFAPGNEGVAGGVGGTFPFGVVVKDGRAYVSSDRDRELVVVDVSSPSAGKLVKRLPLGGNALGLALSPSGARLVVALDNADQVAVIDTARLDVVARIDARGPRGLLPGNDDDGCRDGRGEHGRRKGHRDDDGCCDAGGRYTGAATLSVTLSPDGKTLYAVNAGANSVAVIPLQGEHAYQVAGLIPTGYSPHDVAFSADGRWVYVVNGKSVTGPNPGRLTGYTGSMTSIPNPAAAAAAAQASNQYQFQLERASLVSFPVPGGDELEKLTLRVATNNLYRGGADERDEKVMSFLRKRIKHVIYVVKENRTFDQILGDLGNGSNGDPSLTQFPEPFTPNHHRLAREFVTLDSFYDPGDGSMDGWSWTMQGRVTNTEAITQQINYAFVSRGLSYESEGTNRGVPVNWETVAERDAVAGVAGTTNYSAVTAGLPGGTVNLLTGTGNHASADAPFGEQGGYIFSAVLDAGKTVRSYGFLVNNIGSIGTKAAPVKDPHAAGVVQVAPLEPSLAAHTDLYFRGYDQNYPDLWRYQEWKREFDGYVARGDLPALSMVRISHDHMGSFGTALGGVDTPEEQQADNDLAVGRMVEAVNRSRYADDTLFIIIEDDCQDGPDHVDSHRATAYVVGPYVKKGAIVSTHYTQVNALRTIEDLLGTEHINLNTASHPPMTDVFDVRSNGRWSYTATASTVLSGTELAQAPGGLGVKYAAGEQVEPKHGPEYWARVTEGLDFSGADQVSPARFNRIVWDGLMNGKPYPASMQETAAAK